MSKINYMDVLLKWVKIYSNFRKLVNIYASFSGKSLVGKKDHPGIFLGKKKYIHLWHKKVLFIEKVSVHSKFLLDFAGLKPIL